MLEAVRWRGRTSGEEVRRRIRHPFLVLDPSRPEDQPPVRIRHKVGPQGFVLTGADRPGSRPLLEDESKCIFAIGDVRQVRPNAPLRQSARAQKWWRRSMLYLTPAIGTEPPWLVSTQQN